MVRGSGLAAGGSKVLNKVLLESKDDRLIEFLLAAPGIA
jgi:hypothetical protein